MHARLFASQPTSHNRAAHPARILRLRSARPPESAAGWVHLAEVHHVRQRVVVHEAQVGNQAGADVAGGHLNLRGIGGGGGFSVSKTGY